MDILDNLNQINERDSQNALELAEREFEQLTTNVKLENRPDETPSFSKIVIAGMGGSALAADMVRDWLDLKLPLEVKKDYVLPNYVDNQTLVIVCSFSGNTEETLSALENSLEKSAPTIIATGGGKLLEIAKDKSLPFVFMPQDGQPRMNVLLNLQCFIEIFIKYGLVEPKVRQELTNASHRLARLKERWGKDVPFDDNLAKQIAWHCAGKIPVIYAGPRFRSIAYKWKISFNETSKNVAFFNEYPEFNHNEFLGWSSHPVEKPFAIFDLMSSYDNDQVKKRFALSDRLLSGMRPKAIRVDLEGETMLEQFAYGAILADFASCYLAILNGVDPAPVKLIEKFKEELVNFSTDTV